MLNVMLLRAIKAKLRILSSKTLGGRSLRFAIKDSFFGVRHVQIMLSFLLVTIAYGMRVNLSVGIVAMTDNTTSPNPNIPTYDWNDKSIILSSFFWGYILLQVFAGLLGKSYGPKWFLVVAMTVNAIACIATPLIANNLGSKGVMGCRMIQGLFQGFIYPNNHNLLAKWAPTPERSRMATIVFAGAPFGTVVGMPITGLISASWLGWPAAFYLFGGLGLAWVALWIWLGANSPAEHKTISFEERNYIESTLGQKDSKDMATPWRAIFTSKPVWALIVASFGQVWGYTILLTEIPNYMNKIMNFDMKSNSVLSGAPYLAFFLLSFVVGPMSDYLINHGIVSRGTGRKVFNTIGIFGPAIALIWLSYVPTEQTNLSVALLIMAVGINAAVFCGFQVNHIDLSPNHAGTLMGLANSTSNIFAVIGPLVVHVVVYDEKNKSLWRIIFLISAGLYIASAIFYIIFASGEIQYWNDIDENKNKKESEHEMKNAAYERKHLLIDVKRK